VTVTKIEQYAQAYAEYLGGAEYGQSGKAPFTDLEDHLAHYVRRAVGDGRRAGTAHNNNDPASYDLQRESFRKLVSVAKYHGLHDELLSSCWSIGYRATRNAPRPAAFN
jgi:hypothetical protein